MSRMIDRAEAEEIWQMTESMWRTLAKGSDDSPAWVKADFQTRVFGVLLRQKGVRLNPRLTVANGQEGIGE